MDAMHRQRIQAIRRETAILHAGSTFQLNKEIQMKATKFFVAAGFALATTGALAETGSSVLTYQIDNVTNVYGRAGVAAVQIKGTVQTAGADVNNSGRTIARAEGNNLVTTVDGAAAGRS
jgi:hypothetical protein